MCERPIARHAGARRHDPSQNDSCRCWTILHRPCRARLARLACVGADDPATIGSLARLAEWDSDVAARVLALRTLKLAEHRAAHAMPIVCRLGYHEDVAIRVWAVDPCTASLTGARRTVDRRVQAQRERGPGLDICSKTNGRSAPDLRGAELPQFRTILEELQSEGAAGPPACHGAVGRPGGSSARRGAIPRVAARWTRYHKSAVLAAEAIERQGVAYPAAASRDLLPWLGDPSTRRRAVGRRGPWPPSHTVRSRCRRRCSGWLAAGERPFRRLAVRLLTRIRPRSDTYLRRIQEASRGFARPRRARRRHAEWRPAWHRKRRNSFPPFRERHPEAQYADVRLVGAVSAFPEFGSAAPATPSLKACLDDQHQERQDFGLSHPGQDRCGESRIGGPPIGLRQIFRQRSGRAGESRLEANSGRRSALTQLAWAINPAPTDVGVRPGPAAFSVPSTHLTPYQT